MEQVEWNLDYFLLLFPTFKATGFVTKVLLTLGHDHCRSFARKDEATQHSTSHSCVAGTRSTVNLAVRGSNQLSMSLMTLEYIYKEYIYKEYIYIYKEYICVCVSYIYILLMFIRFILFSMCIMVLVFTILIKNIMLIGLLCLVCL